LKFLKIFTFEELSRTAYLINCNYQHSPNKKRGEGKRYLGHPRKKRGGEMGTYAPLSVAQTNSNAVPKLLFLNPRAV